MNVQPNKQEVLVNLFCLNDQEQSVMRLLYGTDEGTRPMTIEEVAKEQGCSIFDAYKLFISACAKIHQLTADKH